MDTEEDPLKDINNPNWDLIKNMLSKSKVYKEFTCKKCKQVFRSPNYNGKHPLCDKHRFKK